MDRSFNSTYSAGAALNRRWLEEATDPDPDETQEKLRKNDLDTNFGIDQYKNLSKKGSKETFYCEFCKIELNSIETKESHEVGVKHQAKVREFGGDYSGLKVTTTINKEIPGDPNLYEHFF